MPPRVESVVEMFERSVDHGRSEPGDAGAAALTRLRRGRRCRAGIVARLDDAALRGGGSSTGIVEQLGRKLGLDRIDVSTVETVDKETGETGEAAALSLGKDINEDVRVGVEQGIQPGTGSVTVEVDLGKNLSVESRVGAEGRSGVGLKWEYDY